MTPLSGWMSYFFFFQAEDGIRDLTVTGVQTCALPILEIIRSQTTRGGTQIDLTFGWKGDMLRSLQLVQAAMEEVRPSLPPDSRMEARQIGRASCRERV